MSSFPWAEVFGSLGGILGAGGLAGLFRVWWNKRAKEKHEKITADLAKRAMKYDKEDASKVFEAFIKKEEKRAAKYNRKKKSNPPSS